MMSEPHRREVTLLPECVRASLLPACLPASFPAQHLIRRCTHASQRQRAVLADVIAAKRQRHLKGTGVSILLSSLS